MYSLVIGNFSSTTFHSIERTSSNTVLQHGDARVEVFAEYVLG